MQPDTFYAAYRGYFSGILSWSELDVLWGFIRGHAADGWYLYRPGDVVPRHPASAGEVRAMIDRIDAHLRREHREDYCGIVYTDSRSNPALIKIFDPHNLGKVCGSGDHPPLPGWILSRIPPSVLPVPTARKSDWFRSMFGESS